MKRCMMYLEVMQKHFKQPIRYIVIVRDLLDVLASYIKWFETEPTSFLNKYKTLDEKLNKVMAKEGALGIGSSLIYAPAFYSGTDELIALCKVAAEYDGMYISHLRSEGNKFLESLEELLEISEKAGLLIKDSM